MEAKGLDDGPRSPRHTWRRHTVRYGCGGWVPSCVGQTAISGTRKALCGPALLPCRGKRARNWSFLAAQNLVSAGPESGATARGGAREPCSPVAHDPVSGTVIIRVVPRGHAGADHGTSQVCAFGGPGSSGRRSMQPDSGRTRSHGPGERKHRRRIPSRCDLMRPGAPVGGAMPGGTGIGWITMLVPEWRSGRQLPACSPALSEWRAHLYQYC